jgi:hypothetical protein
LASAVPVEDRGAVTDLVVPDVTIHGAGTHVRGRHHVERAVHQAGLTCTDIDIHELFAAGDLYGLMRQLGKVPAEVVF